MTGVDGRGLSFPTELYRGLRGRFEGSRFFLDGGHRTVS